MNSLRCVPSLLTLNLTKPPQTLIPSTLSSPSPNPSSSRSQRWLRARCASDGEAPANPGASLPGLVSKEVDALLRREENRHLLEGLDEASRRVEAARRALADIERQEDEAARTKKMILELQRREAQIAESQKELLEAKATLEEAERSLSSGLGQISFSEDVIGDEAGTILRDLERLESAKAASISSIVGLLASLPISLYQTNSIPQLLQHLVVAFLSGALFGVTFRYTIRRDLDNIQLKTGTSAAFGFVQGLAVLEAAKPLEFNTTSLISQVFDGAVYVSSSVMVFLFSAIALDFCFKTGLLSPFPKYK